MSEKEVPMGLLPTNQADLFFEDNTVGRLKTVTSETYLLRTARALGISLGD